MIIGDKNKFAIEIVFDEFYENEHFIGCGIFKMYVEGFAYGLNKHYASYFCMMVKGFKVLLKERKIIKNIFTDYSDYEIAKTYQYATYEENEGNLVNNYYLGIKGDEFVKKFCDLRDYTGSAFDDGSFMLMFRDQYFVKLIGFQMKTGETELFNLKSITIETYQFDSIIKDSLDYILTEYRANIEKGNYVL